MSETNVHPIAPLPRRPASAGTSRRSFLWLGVIGLIVAALIIGRLRQNPNDDGMGSPAVGKPAPQIDLVRLDSGAALPPDEISTGGKVQWLHFWGTWCGPCRTEYPHLAEVAGQLSENPKFQFLPVSCESGSGETIGGLAQKTSDYFASESIQSPALADPRGVTRQSATERMEQPNLYFPTSILIGPDGKIVGVWEGYTPSAVDQIAKVASDLLLSL